MWIKFLGFLVQAMANSPLEPQLENGKKKKKKIIIC